MELLVPLLELFCVLSVGFIAIYLQLFDGGLHDLYFGGLVLNHLTLLAELGERAVDLRCLLADLIVELLDHRLLLVDDVGDLANLFFLLGSEVLLLLFLLVLEIAELLVELLESMGNLLKPLDIFAQLNVFALQLLDVRLGQIQVALDLLGVDALFLLFLS